MCKGSIPMRCRTMLVATGLLLSVGAPAQSEQANPLDYFNGIWASVNPPGPHVNFLRVGLGTREADLPVLGHAAMRVSNGEYGSNLKVSGDGFDCYYFFAQITAREMTWELKG